MTGMSNGVLDKKTGLTETNIEKFIKAFPDVDLNWLIAGREKNKRIGNSRSRVIPVYNIEALANSEIEPIPNENEFITGVIELPEIRGGDALVRVSGSSMMPLYKSGDRLILKKVIESFDIPFRKPCVVALRSGTVYVKYLHKLDDNNFSLISADPTHEPIVVPKSMVATVFKIWFRMTDERD